MAFRLPSLTQLLQRLIATLLLLATAGTAGAASWQVRIDTAQGLPIITRGGAPAVRSNYVFWGSNWIWASTTTKVQIISDYNYGITGNNSTLGFDLTGSAQKTATNQMIWKFDFDAPAAKSNVIGGGLSFQFDVNSVGAGMGPPVILPDKTGWAWGPVGGNRLEMRFSPVPLRLYVEPGSNEVRAIFYNGSVPAGHTRYTATLTLAGDIAIAPTVTERFGIVNPTTWPSDIMDWRTSPVDLSFLNRPEIPAGKHGFLQTSRDRLVFQDGTVARFWGTNLVAYTLFATSRDGIRQQARRLSQLGFNLVRIHHHDSPWVDPNVFGRSSAPNTLNLYSPSLEKLDWWIKCLKDEGIYVWLDLHAMRFLKKGDGIDYFSEISKGNPDGDLKGYNYVNGSIQRVMRDFGRDYLNHLNPYTNLRYKDDPAIVMLLLTNENDVTQHFGNSLLPDKNVPQHSAIYMDAARKFADTWGLSREATWHSWEYGPSKIFLNDLEYRFNQAMIKDLRSNGVRALIATTNTWANNPMSSLPALSSGDLIDAHAYGSTNELERNPLYAANFVDWMAAAQVAGKPLSITEWNVEPFPVADRHLTPLYVAGTASLQGWDAIMQYAYSQATLDSVTVPSNWHAYSDPALIATLPAAALLYRQGHVREADTVYAFTPTPAELFNQSVSPARSVALRTAIEKGKLVTVLPAVRELPWLVKGTTPAGATAITNLQQALLPANAGAATSDTGQLRRDWEQGIYTINTPRTQAATGWIGGKNIQLQDVNINVTTRNASVVVQALDGRSVGNSRNLMISLGARSVPAAYNQMPFYSEPVTGRLIIRNASGLRLYKRLPNGSEQELPISYNGGAYVLDLTPSLRTYWLLLK